MLLNIELTSLCKGLLAEVGAARRFCSSGMGMFRSRTGFRSPRRAPCLGVLSPGGAVTRVQFAALASPEGPALLSLSWGRQRRGARCHRPPCSSVEERGEAGNRACFCVELFAWRPRRAVRCARCGAVRAVRARGAVRVHPQAAAGLAGSGRTPAVSGRSAPRPPGLGAASLAFRLRRHRSGRGPACIDRQLKEFSSEEVQHG